MSLLLSESNKLEKSMISFKNKFNIIAKKNNKNLIKKILKIKFNQKFIAY